MIGNMVMLVSIGVKNRRLASVLSVAAVFLIWRTKNLHGPVKMLHPANFKDDALIDEFLFIGNAVVPYFVIVLILTVVYTACFRVLIKLSYRKFGIRK